MPLKLLKKEYDFFNFHLYSLLANHMRHWRSNVIQRIIQIQPKENKVSFTTERLIREAEDKLGSAQGDSGGGDFGDKLVQLSIAYSLLAIAQELKRHNDEDYKERQESGK